jgi:hypothetical protein
MKAIVPRVFRVTGTAVNPRFAVVQHDARNGGQTGRSADDARTAVRDPKPTSVNDPHPFVLSLRA